MKDAELRRQEVSFCSVMNLSGPFEIHDSGFSGMCWVNSAAAIQMAQNITKVLKACWGEINAARKIVINMLL